MSASAINEADTTGSPPVPSPHLGWAIVVAVLGFLPFGVVAIIQAVRTSSALASQDLERARKRSRSARRWIIATIVVSVLVDFLILGALLLLGAFAK